MMGKELQVFLTNALGERWPSRDAEPDVRITTDMAQLWWGDEAETEAVVKIRPVSRKELGL